jgi:hypothetical protein
MMGSPGSQHMTNLLIVETLTPVLRPTFCLPVICDVM